MRAIFSNKPDIPTLIDRILNVTQRLALKMDNQLDIFTMGTRLHESGVIHNTHCDGDMIVQVLSTLLSLECPFETPAVYFVASSSQPNLNTQPNIFARMLTHYLQVGRYPHESITDRLYCDYPLCIDDAEQGNYKQIRRIIDVLAVLLATYFTPEAANYQYRYLVSGIHKPAEFVAEQFDERIRHMQHKDLTRITWELLQV